MDIPLSQLIDNFAQVDSEGVGFHSTAWGAGLATPAVLMVLLLP